jgi:hypothetical protein
MKLSRCLLVASLLLPPFEAGGQEHGRIKWRPPTQAEAERKASELATNDSILRKGDIVVTDRGFLMFRGIWQTVPQEIFVPVPNPISNARK